MEESCSSSSGGESVSPELQTQALLPSRLPPTRNLLCSLTTSRDHVSCVSPPQRGACTAAWLPAYHLQNLLRRKLTTASRSTASTSAPQRTILSTSRAPT